jgi:ATP-dependent DNA helicase HFM1/MER3
MLTLLSDSKLGTGQAVVVPVILTRPDQFINCHVMCDGIGVLKVDSSNNSV